MKDREDLRQTIIRIPKAMYSRIKHHAKVSSMSINAWMQRALAEKLAREEENEGPARIPVGGGWFLTTGPENEADSQDTASSTGEG